MKTTNEEAVGRSVGAKGSRPAAGRGRRAETRRPLEKHVHSREAVAALRRALPPDGTLELLAGLFKQLGDPTRVKIVISLLDSELCVHDLSELLGLLQPTVSHQLRVLKQAGLVRRRRDGRHAFYVIADDHVRGIVGQALTRVTEKEAASR